MYVNEERTLVLTIHTKVKGQIKVIESDHSPLYLVVNLPWEVKVKRPRNEMLTRCLIDKDIKVGGKLWLKNMKFTINENFRKVRLN